MFTYLIVYLPIKYLTVSRYGNYSIVHYFILLQHLLLKAGLLTLGMLQ